MYEHTCLTIRELFVDFSLVIPQIHFVLVNLSLITLQKHFSLLHGRFLYDGHRYGKHVVFQRKV